MPLVIYRFIYFCQFIFFLLKMPCPVVKPYGQHQWRGYRDMNTHTHTFLKQQMSLLATNSDHVKGWSWIYTLRAASIYGCAALDVRN